MKGGDEMKEQWMKPELETLEVNKTMLNTNGSHLDNDFPEGTPSDELTFS